MVVLVGWLADAIGALTAGMLARIEGAMSGAAAAQAITETSCARGCACSPAAAGLWPGLRRAQGMQGSRAW
jgi:hypothetical protein